MQLFPFSSQSSDMHSFWDSSTQSAAKAGSESSLFSMMFGNLSSAGDELLCLSNSLVSRESDAGPEIQNSGSQSAETSYWSREPDIREAEHSPYHDDVRRSSEGDDVYRESDTYRDDDPHARRVESSSDDENHRSDRDREPEYEDEPAGEDSSASSVQANEDASSARDAAARNDQEKIEAEAREVDEEENDENTEKTVRAEEWRVILALLAKLGGKEGEGLESMASRLGNVDVLKDFGSEAPWRQEGFLQLTTKEQAQAVLDWADSLSAGQDELSRKLAGMIGKAQEALDRIGEGAGLQEKKGVLEQLQILAGMARDEKNADMDGARADFEAKDFSSAKTVKNFQFVDETIQGGKNAREAVDSQPKTQPTGDQAVSYQNGERSAGPLAAAEKSMESQGHGRNVSGDKSAQEIFEGTVNQQKNRTEAAQTVQDGKASVSSDWDFKNGLWAKMNQEGRSSQQRQGPVASQFGFGQHSSGQKGEGETLSQQGGDNSLLQGRENFTQNTSQSGAGASGSSTVFDPAGKGSQNTSSARNPSRPSASQILEQVEKGMLRNLGQGRRQLVLRLQPEDLGSVRVVLQVRGKEVQAVMHTSNNDTAAVLSDQMQSLRQSLEQQGLKVSRLDVQTETHQGQSDAQWGGAEEHNQMREEAARQARRMHWQNTSLQGEEGLAQEMQSQEQAAGFSSNGLDIFA